METSASAHDIEKHDLEKHDLEKHDLEKHDLEKHDLEKRANMGNSFLSHAIIQSLLSPPLAQQLSRRHGGSRSLNHEGWSDRLIPKA
jgi:hypothetical protein